MRKNKFIRKISVQQIIKLVTKNKLLYNIFNMKTTIIVDKKNEKKNQKTIAETNAKNKDNQKAVKKNDKSEKKFVADITALLENFPKWYTDIVLKTELCDYGPVKGTMVIRPYGFALWENIKNSLDQLLKSCDYQNAYFPMLIPSSFIEKEKEHVAGFAPELATVTHVGTEALAEKLYVRPTSETIIGNMLSKWLQSYKELPMKLNQWCNVVRWEKTTRPFLRTSEFLWHEGHAVFADAKSAKKNALDDLYLYEKFFRDYLAIPALIGQKSEKEKFAGAEITYGIEAMMKDGKSLQVGTSHYLGQNFSKSFDIKFQDDKKTSRYAYTTSVGTSTRMIGAIVMTHGDDRGLVLPPRVAPIQVIIVPIAQHKPGVLNVAKNIKRTLTNLHYRVSIDESENMPGWKFNQWEMKGVPVRVEIGPRDIENNECQIFRRDILTKETVKLNQIERYITNLLDNIQQTMLENATKNRDQRIKHVKTFVELKKAIDSGNFALAPWCNCTECEETIKNETNGISTRVAPFDAEISKDDVCVKCGKPAKIKTIFARAY